MNKKGTVKVAKHPSIWHRDYRWTASLNGSAPSQAKVTPKKSPKPPKRLIDKMIESDDDDRPTESQNDDLVLDQYIGKNEPSQKRFKEDTDSDDRSVEADENGIDDDAAENQPTNEQITPNRNPFKKANPCADPLLSPTRISRDNNSLVKTQSPVKQIDFGKLSKLSRFSRTKMPDHRVISKFFNPAPKENEGQAVKKADSGIQEDLSQKNDPKSNSTADLNPQMKSPNFLDSHVEAPKPTLYYTKSNGINSPNTNEPPQKSSQEEPVHIDMDDDFDRDSQRSIISKFKFVLKNKIDEADSDPIEVGSSQGTSDKTDSETIELPIVLSDDDSSDYNENATSKATENRNWLNSSQKAKTVSHETFVCIRSSSQIN